MPAGTLTDFFLPETKKLSFIAPKFTMYAANFSLNPFFWTNTALSPLSNFVS